MALHGSSYPALTPILRRIQATDNLKPNSHLVSQKSNSNRLEGNVILRGFGAE